jgi:hypothetical protein
MLLVIAQWHSSKKREHSSDLKYCKVLYSLKLYEILGKNYNHIIRGARIQNFKSSLVASTVFLPH